MSSESGDIAVKKAAEMELRDAVSIIVATEPELSQYLPNSFAEAILRVDENGEIKTEGVKPMSPGFSKIMMVILFQVICLLGINVVNLKQIKALAGLRTERTMFD